MDSAPSAQAFREATQQQASELAEQHRQIASLQRERGAAQQEAQQLQQLQLQDASSRRSTLEGSVTSRATTDDVSSQPADAPQVGLNSAPPIAQRAACPLQLWRQMQKDGG